MAAKVEREEKAAKVGKVEKAVREAKAVKAGKAVAKAATEVGENSLRTPDGLADRSTNAAVARGFKNTQHEKSAERRASGKRGTARQDVYLWRSSRS